MHNNIYKSKTSNKSMTFFICFLAALAGLLFGLDIGVVAGALPFIAKDFNINSNQQEWIVASMMLGASIGAIGSGWMSSSFGRKKSLMVGAVLFVVGSLWSALSPNSEILIFTRVLLGIAVGIASYTAPLYLSEIAPEKTRGSMISLYQLMITMGILCAYLSDAAFSCTGNWRCMLGIITIPAVLFLLGVLFLPNSPRWLATKGNFHDAKLILNRLRENTSQAKNELNEIKNSLLIKQSGWSLFQNNKNFRRVVFLGILLQIMQQFTGINVIMYYAPKIFEIAGFTSTNEQMWGTVIIGLVNFLSTFIAISLVDRWGRKPTLILGFLVMSIGMGILATILNINLDLQFIKYLAILMLMVFIIGFAMSAGPLVWVLCSEIQPLKGRDFGITISTTTNWIANMIVGATFLSMLNIIGSANTFWIYALLNIFCIILTIFFVPETKNISLEKIERNLMLGKNLRDIGYSR